MEKNLSNKPTPVEIVRPDFSSGEAWGTVLTLVFNFFTSAWILMLVMGGLHHQLDNRIPAPGYWTTMLIVIAADVLFSGNSMWRFWTRSYRPGEK